MQILTACPTRKSADSERVRPAVSNIKTLKSFIYTNKKSVPLEEEEEEEEVAGRQVLGSVSATKKTSGSKNCDGLTIFLTLLLDVMVVFYMISAPFMVNHVLPTHSQPSK